MTANAILALSILIITGGNTLAADDCAPALDFEKRRSAGDEVVSLCDACQSKVVNYSPQSSKVVSALEELL